MLHTTVSYNFHHLSVINRPCFTQEETTAHRQDTCIHTRIKDPGSHHWAPCLPPATDDWPKLERKTRGRQHVLPMWLTMGLTGPARPVSSASVLSLDLLLTTDWGSGSVELHVHWIFWFGRKDDPKGYGFSALYNIKGLTSSPAILFQHSFSVPTNTQSLKFPFEPALSP